ncbi:MAG: polysaccharide biosynthesis protein [Thermodesulfobacteriota bacterium]
MAHPLAGSRIFITGACGTVGSELIRQLLGNPLYDPAEVIGIDNNESELFFLDQRYLADSRASFFLGDIRDRDKLYRRMRGIDIVFHAAALKHVILCERSPFEAVQTNILGVQNIIAAAFENRVRKVIFTSSDKAVNPTNVMGTSKLMGERLMTAANSSRGEGGPVFTSTRFGNVLGSRGSVIPIFRQQIARGGPVTLTHREMTRFVMSIEEAVRLVIDSVELARGGEVFITKMPVVTIEDLAAVMIEELAPQHGRDPRTIEVSEIGVKPGEKLYEELMNGEETRRAVELGRYFVVLPAFRGLYEGIGYDYPDVLSTTVTNPYVSSRETAIDRETVRSFLRQNGLLGQDNES